MSDNGSHAGTVLVSFVLGAMAGAAVALLYAPGSGEETRRKLAERAREGRSRVLQSTPRRSGERDRTWPRGLRTDTQGVLVSDWAVIWLGVIAVSTGVMAAVQIALIVVSLRVERRLSATADDLRNEIKPLFDKLHRIADDAARATALASVQIERVDQILSTTTARVDEGLSILRNAMGGPLRQGYAVALAVRAAISAFTGRANRYTGRPSATTSRDEEDALFVG